MSLFADPDPRVVAAAAGTGCDRIELYTGPYGATFDDPSAAASEIDQLAATAEAAREAGLAVNAGHDLSLIHI